MTGQANPLPVHDGASDPSIAPVADVVSSWCTDAETGLTAAEAATRLTADGPNELLSKPLEPTWKKLLRQLRDPLVYLLLVAIAISFAAWLAEGATGPPIDVIVIAAIVIANAVLGFVQESKAADAVAALASMTAANSAVVRDGTISTIPSSQLVRGDLLLLSEGDSVGADARLVQAVALKVQEASLTGESAASEKETRPLQAPASIGDRLNMVFKGTAVVSGVGRAVVTSTGMDTEMGHVATMLEGTQAEPTPLQREIDQISKVLGGIVIAIAVIVMAALALINGVGSVQEAVDILLMGVSLAVAAVPEGLPAILSLVLAVGVRAMARRSAVMKDLHSVETLGSASVICSDKTGTLTRNEMMLKTVVTASGRLELTGTGYDPAGEAVVDGPDAASSEARRVLAGGVLANNAQHAQVDGVWEIQGDPTEAAFLVAQHKLPGVAERVGSYAREGEVPFTSDRKMMSVLASRDGHGRRVISKGAPDVLLDHCAYEFVGEDILPLTDQRRRACLDTVTELSTQGYRTLGVASRAAGDGAADTFDDTAERDLVYAGVVGIMDPPRPEAAQAIKEAHQAGIRTIMITGDHPVTAARIAEDLGIVEDQHPPRALTGAELDALSDEEFQAVTREVSVYARVAPAHKLKIVDALQADRQIVAMTGDGVNDAPALKSADIGIAMGITGTEVTKDAGRMILGDDNYATIVAAVRQGRVIFDNIKKFLRYLLSSNMGEVVTVFFGVVLARFLGLIDPENPSATVVPLLATQILWINLVTDSAPALAMGVDPEIDDVMARRPRRYDDRIMDRGMWLNVIAIGMVMGAATLFTFDLCLPGGFFEGLDHLAEPHQQLDVARTTAFTTLVFAQLFNAFNARSRFHSAFHAMFVNPWLLGSVALAVVLQVAVVEVPVLQAAFGTASLDALHWFLAIGAASVVLWFEEIVKLIRRALPRT